MRPQWCFDTSALVSLGHTDRISEIVSEIGVVVTGGIISELEAVAGVKDDDGMSAKRWLVVRGQLTMARTARRPCAEDEAFAVCKQRGIPLVLDDIQAFKRFKKEIRCLFSVQVIYLLYLQGVISKESAIITTEKMKKNRDWRDNAIALVSRTLYE